MKKDLLSPKELALAIGVSESSVKRWADSGRLQTLRTAGGHRRIPREEALRFLRAEELRLMRPDLLGLEEVAETGAARRGDPAETLYRALLHGREAQARGILIGLYLDGRDPATILDRVLTPALTRVGELWKHDEAGIYVEHRAVDICERALEEIRRLAPPVPTDAPVAVGGGLPEDSHSLPSRMAATVLRERGWRVINLGAFTPYNVMARAAEANGARLVWLAISMPLPADRLRREVGLLRQALEGAGSTASLVVGGPALPDASPRPIPGVHQAGTFGELIAFANGLYAGDRGGNGPPPLGEEIS